MNNFNQNQFNAMLNANGIKPSISDSEAKTQMRIAKILVETKTDWDVIKLPLQTIPHQREVSTWNEGTDTLDTTLVNTPIPLTKMVGQKDDGTGGTRRGLFAMVREDNSEVFGTGSEQYTIVQNKDIAEVLCGIQDHFPQMNLEVSAEVLDGGSKVQYRLHLPDEVIEGQQKGNVVGHKILRSITITNSHDGSSSVKFGIYHEVCVCANGMYLQSQGVKKAFRHTLSVNDRIKDAVEGFALMLEEELMMLESYRKMAKVEVKIGHVEGIIKGLFNVPKDAKLLPAVDGNGIMLSKDTQVNMSTKALNQVNTFITKALVPELAQKGATMWGLMNAVTQYTNSKGGTIDHLRRGHDVEHLITGDGMKKNQKAYETMLGWLREPLAPFVEVMHN